MEITPRLQATPGCKFATLAKPQEAATEEAARDTVKMSNEALLLTEALRGAQTAPDVREDKVAELKAAIESGAYTVNARLIAEKMLGEETSLYI